MRLFLAIELPETWRKLLAKPQESIGWLGHGIKWVDPKSTHLTLKFLGEVPPNLVDPVRAAAQEICGKFPAFTMRMKGTGVFPNPKQPRVYWAGVQAPETLYNLQTELESAMAELGYEPEARKFNPHLTVARIKDPNGKQRTTDAFLSFRIEAEPFTVNEVALMRSHLSEDGARYEAQGHFPLGRV